jgi:hypothetical protein
MFDMKWSTMSNAGYQLRITYSSQYDNYILTGYIVLKEGDGHFNVDRDGAPLMFATLDDVLNHITNYKTKGE